MSIAIRAEKLSKMYHIGKKHSGSLRETITGKFNNFFSKNKNDVTEFWALKDVSFEIQPGEVVGIIGKNGAGKSTLLKILSRITEPTSGRVEINGRVSSLLEVGTGFHPELTGRENIFMNGAILGMKRAEIKNKFDEIVAFSGIEQFIETPVKRYSSGMYVRLAFAVAAHLEPEILIIDEVLAVGDAEFQKKCLGKMRDVSEREGRTVLFVSHNMNAVVELCKKGILLINGSVAMKGGAPEIVEKYLENLVASNFYLAAENNKEIYISKSEIFGLNGSRKGQFRFTDSIKITVDSLFRKSVRNLYKGMAVRDGWGKKIFTSVCLEENIEPGIHHFSVTIPAKTIISGNYSVDLALFDKNDVYEYNSGNLGFLVVDTESELSQFKDPTIGSVFVNCKWE